MAHLTRASRQLFARPADERYVSLAALALACRQERQLSTDRWTPPNSLQPISDGHSLKLAIGPEDSFALNHWSFSQICGMCGVARDTLNRLAPPTAAQALRETWPQGNKPLQVFTSDTTVRSIHGTTYTRLYNADLVALVQEMAGEFTPPPPGCNGATGLYLGEQDLFCFLIDPTGWAEIEGEPFAPGFFVWNSEVGKASVGISTFWFQSICQNHIVWDATDVTEITRKHTGKVGEAFGEIRQLIESLVSQRNARRDGFVALMKKAIQTKLGDDADEVVKLLAKHGFSRSLAQRATELAYATQSRFSVFSVVDALTQLSQEAKYAGDRTDADTKAATLLKLVA